MLLSLGDCDSNPSTLAFGLGFAMEVSDHLVGVPMVDPLSVRHFGLGAHCQFQEIFRLNVWFCFRDFKLYLEIHDSGSNSSMVTIV